MMKRSLFCFPVIIVMAASCFGGASRDNSGAGSHGIRVAHTHNYYPYCYINENGESDGFEVAVLREINALMPEYVFEFIGTSDDDLLIGVESGKYALGVKGAWLTEERKSKFIIPQTRIGASIIGLVFRTENADRITGLESFARFSGALAPIPPLSAQWSLVEEFNRNHPDSQIKLIPSDVFIIADAYTWVAEGRYDGFLDIKLSFEATVMDENGPWHRYAPILSYAPYRAIPTYPLINRNYPELAEKIEAAMQVLIENGAVTELSLQYFGEDIFRYL